MAGSEERGELVKRKEMTEQPAEGPEPPIPLLGAQLLHVCPAEFKKPGTEECNIPKVAEGNKGDQLTSPRKRSSRPLKDDEPRSDQRISKAQGDR